MLTDGQSHVCTYDVVSITKPSSLIMLKMLVFLKATLYVDHLFKACQLITIIKPAKQMNVADQMRTQRIDITLEQIIIRSTVLIISSTQMHSRTESVCVNFAFNRYIH